MMKAANCIIIFLDIEVVFNFRSKFYQKRKAVKEFANQTNDIQYAGSFLTKHYWWRNSTVVKYSSFYSTAKTI